MHLPYWIIQCHINKWIPPHRRKIVHFFMLKREKYQKVGEISRSGRNIKKWEKYQEVGEISRSGRNIKKWEKYSSRKTKRFDMRVRKTRKTT